MGSTRAEKQTEDRALERDTHANDLLESRGKEVALQQKVDGLVSERSPGMHTPLPVRYTMHMHMMYLAGNRLR